MDSGFPWTDDQSCFPTCYKFINFQGKNIIVPFGFIFNKPLIVDIMFCGYDGKEGFSWQE